MARLMQSKRREAMDSKADIIAALYRGMLEREPDEVGLRTFLDRMESYEDVSAFLREFIESEEFRERNAPEPADPDNLRNPFWHYNSSFDAQAVIRRHAVPDLQPRPGYVTNFLGVAVDPKIYPAELVARTGQVEPVPIPTNWHADVAEWASVLRAVEFAHERFTVIELGCGWACWMNNAGAAARRRGLDVHVIGVEGDTAHIGFAQEALATNGFTPDQITLHHGIAASTTGTALFPQGDRDGQQWGGQPIFGVSDAERDAAVESGRYEALRMFTLAELAAPYPRIDLLHIDIQGGEADLIAGSLETLNAKVAYMFIGSHSREIEGRLLETLIAAGWVLEIERPGFLTLGEHGTYMHCDGAQGWRNKALLPTP